MKSRPHRYFSDLFRPVSTKHVQRGHPFIFGTVFSVFTLVPSV